MSTSSSSTDVDCCDYGVGETIRKKYAYDPDKPDTCIRQPYVYFMHIPHGFRGNNDVKKGVKNKCFEKAFKWYTKERGSVNCKPGQDCDVPGFARWLDRKYEEYLVATGETVSCRVKHYNSIDYNDQPMGTCEPCSSNRKKIKRHWRNRLKKRSDAMQNETIKPSRSFEIIMYPKDVTSHLASVCNYQAATAIQDKVYSETTTVVKKKESKLRTVQKAQSATNACKQIFINECVLNNQSQLVCCDMKKNTKKHRKVECECFKVKPAHTEQCRCRQVMPVTVQDDFTSTHNNCQNINCDCIKQKNLKHQGVSPEVVKHVDKNVPDTIERTIVKVQIQNATLKNKEMTSQTPRSTEVKNEAVKHDEKIENVDKNVTVTDTEIQTSDRDIVLNKEVPGLCPVFLKVVYNTEKIT